MRSFDIKGKVNRSEYLRKRTGYACEVCGEKYPEELLELHHPEGVKKERNFDSHTWRKIKQEVIDEADKCVILCSNCHRLEHIALKNGETLINDKEAYSRYRNHRFSSYKGLDDRDERHTNGDEEEFPCAPI